ncbi:MULTISPECIES: hypothetical protein [unclassified Microcoleus]
MLFVYSDFKGDRTFCVKGDLFDRRCTLMDVEEVRAIAPKL